MKYFFKRKMLYAFMVLGGVLVIILSIMHGNDWVEILSELVAILGVELLVVELHQARLITQADFIANLNENFVSNDDYKKVFSLFENYDFDSLPDLEIESQYVSNYLTYFEAFQLMIERGAASIDLLNDLFGYRFFISVHNPYVQKIILNKGVENYKNLIILEHNWSKYRKDHGYNIFHEEYAFENVIDSKLYKKIMSMEDK